MSKVKFPDGSGMRTIADFLKSLLPGLGFALFVFKFHEPGISNYIFNAERETMLQALRETYLRISGGQDIATPENN